MLRRKTRRLRVLKLSNSRVSYDSDKETFRVSFTMSKEIYESTKTCDMVQDLGLAVLAGIEQRCLKDRGELDSPDTPAVELKENKDEV
jgi:hypothetical protein